MLFRSLFPRHEGNAVRARYLFSAGEDVIKHGLPPRAEGWHGFRFGSESCPHLLPPVRELGRLRMSCGSFPCSLVTPVAAPSDLERVLQTARDALNAGWDEVVVNDWGVLSELSPGNGDAITAGRLLLRLRRGPGTFDPWSSLDEDSRRYFAWGPLYDGSFLSFLMDMGVPRLEIDAPRHWMPLPEVKGFQLSFHADSRLVSIASRCPWLYSPAEDRWEQPARCRRACMVSGPVLMYAGPLGKPLMHRGREILEDASGDWREKDLPGNIDRLVFSSGPIIGMESAKCLLGDGQGVGE